MLVRKKVSYFCNNSYIFRNIINNYIHMFVPAKAEDRIMPRNLVSLSWTEFTGFGLHSGISVVTE